MHRHEEGLCRGKEFVERNREQIRKIACYELRDKGCANPEADADDVAHDVSIALMEAWPTLNSPEGAMYRFTVNAAKNHARRCRREPAIEIPDDQAPCFSPPGLDPDKMIEDLEFIMWVQSKLNEKEALIFKMRFTLGMSFSSIAAQLKMPSGTVRANYTRSKIKLKEALKARAAEAAVTPRPL